MKYQVLGKTMLPLRTHGQRALSDPSRVLALSEMILLLLSIQLSVLP